MFKTFEDTGSPLLSCHLSLNLDCGVCVLFTNLAACTRTLQIHLHAFVLQSEAF